MAEGFSASSAASSSAALYASNREIDDDVATLATRPVVAVALDFDGVLAPFHSDPMAVAMVDGAAEVLARIAATPGLALALISGRRLPDILLLAEPPTGALLATSHGAERSLVTDAGVESAPVELTPDQTALLDRLHAELGRIAGGAPGVWVEEKPFGRSLHTRRSSPADAEAAAEAALAGPASWPGTHTISGKAVVEIAVVSTTKADGVAWVREQVAAEAGVPVSSVAVLFAGDDRTDEDALRALLPGDLGVKVGPGETAARLRVRDEAAVVDLLRRLLAAR